MELLEANWKDAYEKLLKFGQIYRHMQVPQRYIDSDGFRLGLWVSNQRIGYNKGKLEKWKIEKLERCLNGHGLPILSKKRI